MEAGGQTGASRLLRTPGAPGGCERGGQCGPGSQPEAESGGSMARPPGQHWAVLSSDTQTSGTLGAVGAMQRAVLAVGSRRAPVDAGAGKGGGRSSLGGCGGGGGKGCCFVPGPHRSPPWGTPGGPAPSGTAVSHASPRGWRAAPCPAPRRGHAQLRPRSEPPAPLRGISLPGAGWHGCPRPVPPPPVTCDLHGLLREACAGAGTRDRAVYRSPGLALCQHRRLRLWVSGLGPERG